MAAIKMLCMDIDGTLLNSKLEITPATRQAIVRAHQEKGVHIILASSRMPQGMTPFLEVLGLSQPMSCYGGGLIVEEDRILFSQSLPLNSTKRACEIALSCGAHPTVWGPRNWYAREMDELVTKETAIIGGPPVISDYPPLFAGWERDGFAPNKVLCMGKPAVIDRLTAALEQEEGLWDLARSKDVYLEVGPKGVSKGTSVNFLCDYYGISPQEVMAIGDQGNDLSMLLAAGLGVAMGNAPDHIKEQADAVTASNEEDGIALAIERYILGGHH
ncbi:Cof-type HAD-IIB family hydrolase [Oscillospiraceae bacterium MB08-C2-2]|nr:Cof-type HAD-IIB family hydrolase [Oscillospiraceae bacterium MB08-C2-2]